MIWPVRDVDEILKQLYQVPALCNRKIVSS